MTAKVDPPALGRAMGMERTLVAVIGTLAVLAGLAALIVGAGWLGTYRAQRPVLDPMLPQWWSATPHIAIPLALLIGVVLFALGLQWLRQTLRPEPRPNVRLETGPTGTLTVTSSALVAAVRADAESIDEVQRVRARTAGNQQRPSLRLTLWLREGSDVRRVWHEVDGRVLSRAREALDVETLPAVIRLELDRAPRQRAH